MSRARLICWIALVGAVSALEYSARFSSTPTKNTRDDVYSYSAFGNGLIFYGLIFGVVLAIAFDRTDLFALRRPARRAAQRRGGRAHRDLSVGARRRRATDSRSRARSRA